MLPYAGADDDHVPPATGSLSEIVDPTHTADGPDIGPGDAFTVTSFVVVQLPNAYVIVTTPGETPDTTPEDEPMEPTKGLLLVHKPPEMPSVSGSVDPTQTVDDPTMTDGAETTLTVTVV